MKLMIQIPCYNEEKTLPQTLAGLPQAIAGIDRIEIQVIDDGSVDRTVEIARNAGVHHIISLKTNKGLAAAFRAGVEHALQQKADILVNTDGDNQYLGDDIARLVRPIVDGKADLVIGARPIRHHPEFSLLKKILQRVGSAALRSISGTEVSDAASGFRAYSQQALLRLNVFSNFSYCMETLIQAGLANMKIESVDIRVNPKTRDSRLFGNLFDYLFHSGGTILSVYFVYRAKTVFLLLSLAFFTISAALALRYYLLIHVFGASGGLFWPTIILAGVLLVMSLVTLFTGLLASILAANRALSEEIVYRLRKIDLGK